MELEIKQEFFSLIPPLSQDEVQSLILSLRTEGCRQPIIVWKGKNIIVDGHNRYAICTKLKIPFKVEDMEFKDENEVMIWMINNQFARRNLSLELRLDLTYKLREVEQKQAQERMLAGKKIEDKKNLGVKDTPGTKSSKTDKKGKTLEIIAKKAGTSYKTTFKYDTIQRKGTDEQKEAVRSGKKKIGTVYKEIQANEKPAAKPQIQSNECDIENLLKGKTIKTPYLLLYSKQDEESGEEMHTYLSNCEPSANILICRDYMMNVAHGNCPEDDFVQSRIALRRMIDGLVFKEATNAQE